ncbi:MAG: TPM domain-containing protein, partial [Cyanobacteria bacterium J06598_3]
KTFATELFNAWGIGKAGEDNGVLFLVSKGDRRTEVETGYGMEGILPDAKVGRILDTQVTPQFKAGNFDGGITSGTMAIVSAITGEAVSLPTTLTVPPAATAVPQVQPAIAQPSPVTARSQPLTNTSARTLADESTEFRVFMGVLFTGLFAATIGAVIALKPLRTGQLKPIQIEPVGQSDISRMGNLSFYLWPRAWIGKTTLTRFINGKGLFSVFQGGQYAATNKRLASKSSWLEVHHRNKQFRNVSASLLGLFVIFSIAMTGFGFQSIVISLVVVGAWLAVELWLSNQQAQVSSPLFPTVKRFLFISFLVIAFLIPVALFTGGLGLFAAPFLLVTMYGTTAGLLRFFRVSEQGYEVLCKDCDRPMQILTSTQLSQQLSQPQKAELRIGTKGHEGWYCLGCNVRAHSNTSNANAPTANFHFFSFRLKKPGYKTCKTCEAMTLRVTSTVIRAATTYSSGARRITTACACCNSHSQKTVTIPKKSTSSSSSSGSSHSSGSSSSSSSGGSFGGGSSGGGGAGSSW